MNECQCWRGAGGRCGHCDSRLREIEYEWQSTPALWAAMRPGYDGAPDSHCPIGFGKTKEQAAEDLREQEAA